MSIYIPMNEVQIEEYLNGLEDLKYYNIDYKVETDKKTGITIILSKGSKEFNVYKDFGITRNRLERLLRKRLIKHLVG